MPDSVIELDSFAIHCIKNLKSAKLSANLKEISLGNFSDCDSIEIIDFLENVESIDGYTFGCKNLKKVVIPASVKSIAGSDIGGAFRAGYYNSSSCKVEVVLDERNEHLICKDNCIFSKDMKELIRCFPAGRVRKFTVPDSVISINECAFEGCYYKQIEMNDNVTKLGRYVFESCEKLEEIKLSENLTTIPYGAFMLCRNLKKINISHRIQKISGYAFCDCISLEEITLPENLKKIEVAAFSSCFSLTEIALPESLKEIESFVFRYTFPEKIHIPKKSRYAIYNNCLIDKRKKEILLHIGDEKIDERVFEGIESIGEWAFACKDIANELKIPENIKFIKKRAFENCKNLVKVHIPSSVKSINYDTFFISAIKELVISEGVTQIKDFALSGMKYLKKITIPESVAKIGKYAFDDDSKVTIYCKENSRAHRFAKENKIKFKILPKD